MVHRRNKFTGTIVQSLPENITVSNVVTMNKQCHVTRLPAAAVSQ